MNRVTLAPIVLAAAYALATPALAQPAPEAAAPEQSIQNRWNAQTFVIPSGEWRGNRLADGQPDVEGHWSNTVSNHSNFTDPQAGPPGEPSRTAHLPRDQRAPSRVSDPADGQIPYLPAARALQQDFERNFANPTKQKYIEPLVRCAPGGVPKSFYWHGFDIRQYPGYVAIFFNAGTRIIHLSDQPHLHPSIKLWNGDSRGRWEGNTLVVDVRNNNGKALFSRTGDFMSENGVVEERFVFSDDGKSFNYIATFDDPTVYSRKWTATVPMRRYTEADSTDGWHYETAVANRPGQPVLHEQPERVCIENNGPFGGGAVGVPITGPVINR